MSDFEDRLARLLRDDGDDPGPAPDPVSARGSWRRRRSRRLLAASATLMSGVAIVVAGVVIARQGDSGRDSIRVVDRPDDSTQLTPTSVPDEPVPTASSSTAVTTVPRSSLPASSTTVGSDTSTVDSPQPSTTSESTTATPTTNAAAGVAIDPSLVGATVGTQVDNRIELRDSAGSVVWAHDMCPTGVLCRGSVQTATDEGVWLVIDEGDEEAFGDDLRSVLVTVDADGERHERFAAPTGASILAGQPTPIGLVVAVSTRDEPGGSARTEVLVLDETGPARTLYDEVDGVEISLDGRFLAVTASDPFASYGDAELVVSELATGQENRASGWAVTFAPIEWAPDGSSLVVGDTWEGSSQSLVDPWQETIRPWSDELVSAEAVCLIDRDHLAVGRWHTPYAEAPFESGPIDLVEPASGSTSTIVADVVADSLACFADGSVVVRRPDRLAAEAETGDRTFGPSDPGARSELVHIGPDGVERVLDRGVIFVERVR